MNKQTKTKIQKFPQSAKCINNHSSRMGNRSWFELNNKVNLRKADDLCPNPKCKCQKQKSSLIVKFCSRELDSKKQ